MLWPLLVIACLSLNAASGSIPNSTKSLQRPSRDQKGKNPESCSQCYKTFLLENLENFISPKCETGRIGQLEPINSFLLFRYWPVWPNWAIYWTLGNILKPLAKINLPKSSTFLGNFCKGVIFLVISFLGNFYRHFSIFSGHTGTDHQVETWIFIISPNDPTCHAETKWIAPPACKTAGQVGLLNWRFEFRSFWQ